MIKIKAKYLASFYLEIRIWIVFFFLYVKIIFHVISAVKYLMIFNQ
jgi:hypothetical protein